MRVLVAGASGLIGSRLLAALEAAGHQAGRLVRDQARAGGTNFYWNPEAGELDRAALADCDAIVNLAGESIVGRWSAAKKQRIRESRIAATRTIAETLAAVQGRTRILINASAVGIYGDRGDELLDESSARRAMIFWPKSARPGKPPPSRPRAAAPASFSPVLASCSAVAAARSSKCCCRSSWGWADASATAGST